MACGTGKTLVSLWAAEEQNPKTVLVLVPSLTLLQQTLREWSEQTKWGRRFSYICVCSDPTVDLKDDVLNTDKSEFGFRIDTDPAIVRRFLTRETSDIKVIFATYHSSPVVGAGACGLPPIDIAIFDEAHKTIGLAGSAFGYALSDKNLNIEKRLFLTATPKHIDIRHRDKEGEFRIYSMDDPSIYGRRAHKLSFAAAAQKGIICPYKVIISKIDKGMVDDFTRKNGITLVEMDKIGAQLVANLIALQRAIEHVEAKKVISFHSRVRLAQEFATDEPRGIAHHLKNYDVRHVNGTQSSALRGDIIRAFADAPKAILTNARCLTEGVNIPAVDMIAFIDPRRSRIDIAQAVGRAMRKPRNGVKKERGYVVVPLFVGVNGDDLDEAIKSERFDAVVEVLNAMQEHDDELVDIIREIKQRKGEGKPFNPKRLMDKIEVIGPRVEFDCLSSSIGIEIADRIGVNWDEWFGLLLKFKQREGHCRVAQRHFEGTHNLGQWVSQQRLLKETMSAEQRRQLDKQGFVWDERLEAWNDAFAALMTFKRREGHCRVPRAHVEEDFKLGRWVVHQRTRKDSMPSEWRKRLEEHGFVWDTNQDDWEQGFQALLRFKHREGHCNVTSGHKEKNFNLGHWVTNQRAQKEILPERRRLLEKEGFSWGLRDKHWEAGFGFLMRFKQREGHCRVPQKHFEGDFNLGAWVSNQRVLGEKMLPERTQRLNEQGFVWHTLEDSWERGYAALLKFKQREGHCLVPDGHIEGDFRLGGWISQQRGRQETMSAERKRLLDEQDFVWNVLQDAWRFGYGVLLKFKEREGHCRVPPRHLEDDFKLGQWVSVQRLRNKSGKVPPEQVRLLDEQRFVWDPHQETWERGFAALIKFKEREGHCLVPPNYREGPQNLGRWVYQQRRSFRKGSLSDTRIARLEAEGFEWTVAAGRVSDD